MSNTKLKTQQTAQPKSRIRAYQKPITKTNMAISIDIELSEELREVAKLEDRSISYVIQKCVEGYLPVIKSEQLQNGSFNLERMITRLAAAVTTPDMRRCGVKPSVINLNEHGQVVIDLQRTLDDNGNAIPVEDDIAVPFEMTARVVGKECGTVQGKRTS